MMTSLYVAIYNVHNSRGENDNKYYRKIFKCIINIWCPLKKILTNDE